MNTTLMNHFFKIIKYQTRLYGGVKIQKSINTKNKQHENFEKSEKLEKSENSEEDSKDSREKSGKNETCYTCGKKFEMNKEEGSRYRYEKFPLCAYCAEFYGFYFNDPGQKRRKKE